MGRHGPARRAPEPVAGIDGCPGGWVVARAVEGAGTVEIERVGSIGSIIEEMRRGGLRRLAIDMPFGLADTSDRDCDRLARRELGRRASTVFPAPVRGVLECGSYAEALTVSRRDLGKGLSKQAWHLVPKIRELDEALRHHGADGVQETHPELAFAHHRGGEPLAESKHSPAGLEARRAIVQEVFPALDVDAARPAGARIDDVLDAAILADAALRWLRGEGRRLGDDDAPPSDRYGLPMAVYA